MLFPEHSGAFGSSVAPDLIVSAWAGRGAVGAGLMGLSNLLASFRRVCQAGPSGSSQRCRIDADACRVDQDAIFARLASLQRGVGFPPVGPLPVAAQCLAYGPGADDMAA